MYCKLCKKNVKSIGHWAKEHKAYLKKKSAEGRGKTKRSKAKGKKCPHCGKTL